MSNDARDRKQHRAELLDETRELIEQERANGSIDRDRYEELMAKAHELQERVQRDEEAIRAKQYEDPHDAYLEKVIQARKRLAQKRSLEFKALGIDLPGLVSEYDDLIRSLRSFGNLS